MYHDEMYNEAGKLPILSNLLVTALSLFVGGPRQKLIRLIPQARLGNYRTDYSITLVESKFLLGFHILKHSLYYNYGFFRPPKG